MSNEWISVSERLPSDENKMVLRWGNGYLSVGTFEKGVWRNSSHAVTHNQKVTHWLVLPPFAASMRDAEHK